MAAINRLYEPQLPPDDLDLPATRAWFLQELRAVGNMMRYPVFPRLYAAPSKPFDGMAVLADGTSWNPGSGKGLYVYDGTGAGVWRFIALA